MYSITSSFVDFLEGFTEIQHVYVSDISLRHSLEKVRGDDQVLRLTQVELVEAVLNGG